MQPEGRDSQYRLRLTAGARPSRPQGSSQQSWSQKIGHRSAWAMDDGSSYAPKLVFALRPKPLIYPICVDLDQCQPRNGAYQSHWEGSNGSFSFVCHSHCPVAQCVIAGSARRFGI
jgi:hypothetical protein